MAGATQGAGGRAAAPLESSIVKGILKYLNNLPECYAIKTRGDYHQAGQPDILGSWQGRSLALEVKRPGGRVTQLQLAILAKWRQAGAVAGVVYGVEDVKKLIGEDNLA